ncbi:AfsR/SARP family transcriptional regulator [Streptomyces sp. NPDC048301]|uniref:AfsR/SARP family transcriptional regulator n=1 Tax=unclassified Streptomyces TaxID=2593676 RepID=UPI00342507F3
MRIDMLGRFSASIAGVPITPSAGKPRRILALLALHAGQAVPVSAVVDEIWGAAASPRANITVQTYVLQLRNFIGLALGDPRAGRDVLVTRPGSYALLLDALRTDGARPETGGADTVDVHVYDRLCARGQSAIESGDDTTAVALFRQALTLWKGPALDDVRSGPALGLEAMRLEQSRLDVLERCLTAEVRLGAGERLLPELTALAEQQPQHEALHGLLMTVLDRVGRTAGALGVYEALRARLDERFGLRPSPGLRRLEREIRERTGHLV